ADLELVADASTRKSDPRVEFVDVAVGGDARVRLRHARSVEQGGLAAVAGLGIDFHRVGDYKRFQGFKGFPQDSRARGATAVPAPPARLVPQERARPSMAPDNRSVPHPRLRSDAPADAGRSRAAEVSRVAREISQPARVGGGAGGGRRGYVAAARL